MTGRPIWLWAAAAVLAILVGFRVATETARARTQTQTSSSTSTTPGQPAPPDAVRISIASSFGKQAWLHQATGEFNAASIHDSGLQVSGKPISVEILQETVNGVRQDYRSRTMLSDTFDGKIKPTILSPSDEATIQKLQRDWQAMNSGQQIARDIGPSLARTPLVFAMWQSRATALGCWPTPEPRCTWEQIRQLAASPEGWGLVGRSDWGTLKIGYGYVGESSVGNQAAALMCMLGAGKPQVLTLDDIGVDSACGRFMSDVERAKTHSGTTSDWLLGQMTGGGPEYLDTVIIYEVQVIDLNRLQAANLREPVVAVYPQDGTFLVGHPFTVLDGAPWVTADQRNAAGIYLAYLLATERQRALVSTGLRPANDALPLGDPIATRYGANPQANIVNLAAPDALTSERITEVWHRVKKHAVIALVFDKSGSMAGGKITAAIRGAEEFVKTMDRDDLLIWMPFDGRVHPPFEGSVEQMLDRIRSTPASGDTALYDAVLAAQDRLEAVRRDHRDSRRYGIVILSDGRDTHSNASLATIEARLKPGESDPHGVQIHAIAIGNDADEGVLRKIAGAAHGRFWKTQATSDTVAVYRSIATYY